MRRPLLALLATAHLTSACATTIDATRIGVPVTLASSVEAPPQGERFDLSSSVLWAFWGAVRVKESSLRETLSSQLVGAREIRDVRIRIYSKWPQVLVSVITLGILVPRTVRAEGVIVGATPAGAAPAVPGATR